MKKYPVTETQQGRVVYEDWKDIIPSGSWYVDDTDAVRQSVTDDMEYWYRRSDYKKILCTIHPFTLPNVVCLIEKEGEHLAKQEYIRIYTPYGLPKDKKEWGWKWGFKFYDFLVGYKAAKAKRFSEEEAAGFPEWIWKNDIVHAPTYDKHFWPSKGKHYSTGELFKEYIASLTPVISDVEIRFSEDGSIITDYINSEGVNCQEVNVIYK